MMNMACNVGMGVCITALKVVFPTCGVVLSPTCPCILIIPRIGSSMIPLLPQYPRGGGGEYFLIRICCIIVCV